MVYLAKVYQFLSSFGLGMGLESLNYENCFGPKKNK
jgi:hypothetical protein